MIKLSQTLLLLLMVVSLSAQKVKLKDFKVSAEHVNLPSIGFEKDVTTFDVSVDGSETGLNRYGSSPSAIAGKVKIGGYNKVEGGGSVSIFLNVGTPNSSGRQTTTTDKKDKEGKTWKEYNYYFNFDIASSYKVVDNKGNILSEKSIPQTSSIKTPVYKSLVELNKYYKKNYPAKSKEAMRNLLNKAVSEMVNSMNREFSVGKVTSRVFFEGLKSKKHPEKAKWEKITPTVEDAFKKMKVDDNQAYIAAIQPAIDFWLAQEPKYSAKDKHQRKLKYACQRNAAVAYFWAEDFDNAIKYASMAASGEFNEKKGKRLKERYESVQKKMAELQMPTRHFVVELSEEDEAAMASFAADKDAAFASGDIRMFPQFKKEMNAKMDSRVERGTMYFKNGNTIEGYFVYDSGDFTPDFRFPGNIRFGTANGQEIEKTTPKYDKMDSLKIGDVMFRVRPVQVGEGLLSVKLKNAIVEVVKDYGRTRLEIAHPPFKYAKAMGKNTELESSYVIWHKKKKKHYSPDGLSFSKSMKKAVGDCTASVEYINNMKATKKKKKLLDKLASANYQISDIMEILNLYESCKK